jgi:hypothetical protein
MSTKTAHDKRSETVDANRAEYLDELARSLLQQLTLPMDPEKREELTTRYLATLAERHGLRGPGSELLPPDED